MEGLIRSELEFVVAAVVLFHLFCFFQYSENKTDFLLTSYIKCFAPFKEVQTRMAFV